MPRPECATHAHGRIVIATLACVSIKSGAATGAPLFDAVYQALIPLADTPHCSRAR